jgi:hypothetical protein
MPDLFAHADAHGPIVSLREGEDITARIGELARSGCRGVRLRSDAGHDLVAVDAVCNLHGMQWWLSIEVPAAGMALHARSFEVGAGGAAGAWQRVQHEAEWIAARAVPLGARGLNWRESLDLLEPNAGRQLATWNNASRIFLFSPAEQNSFWPDAQHTNDVLQALEVALPQGGKASAWRGVWLDFAGETGGGNAPAPPAFPFAHELEATFSRQTGRDFKSALASLIADTGAGAVADRLAFWEAAFTRAEADFWQPLRAACDERKLDLAVSYAPDRPSALEMRWGETVRRYADRIAVVSDVDAAQPAIALRQAGSYAALDRREAPLAAPYDGVALCASAGAALAREEDAGDAVSNAYLARCGALAAWGRSGARTALLWPTRSLRSHYNPRAHRFVRWVENDLLQTARFLETLHFDFLLLPGGDLETARVEEAKSTVENDRTLLRCGRGGHGFEMIVLPSVTTLAQSAWSKLEAFVEAGGKVVCLGLLPRWSERGRDEELEARISRTTMITISDLYAAYGAAESGISLDEISGVGYPVARSNARGGRLSCYQPRLNTDAADARLRVRQLLMDSLEPTVQSQSESLLVARRVSASDELFLLHNHEEKAARIPVRLDARAAETTLQWVEGNQAMPVTEWMALGELEGGGISIPLEMAGGETRALLLTGAVGYESDVYHVERANFVVQQVTADAALGYATQSGVPTASWMENERIVTRSAAPVLVPPPMLLDWHAEDGHFTTQVALPESWHDCVVWLEVAGCASFALWVNGREGGRCVAPPWKMEIETQGEDEIELRIACDAADSDLIARLAAYPRVEIRKGTVEFDRTT